MLCWLLLSQANNTKPLQLFSIVIYEQVNNGE